MRHAAFTLIGAGTWVGKSAHLANNPLTIQKGWQVIAQAVTEYQIEARGPGCPCSHLTTPKHSDSIMDISPHGKNASKMLALTIGPHTTSHHEAGTMNGSKGTQGRCYANPLHLPLIEDLKVIGVWC